MFAKKIATIGLLSLSATTILFADVASAQVVNQQIKDSTDGFETFVNANNLTVNSTGILNQDIDCYGRNNVPNIDPLCDVSNTAINGSSSTTSPSTSLLYFFYRTMKLIIALLILRAIVSKWRVRNDKNRKRSDVVSIGWSGDNSSTSEWSGDNSGGSWWNDNDSSCSIDTGSSSSSSDSGGSSCSSDW
ncbi:hypothetical protein F7734_07395 [Scytonema sp. UIC 10036]|uniref:hypothetical protein n=1 Tax=Scytonema sp. UIC 10036 TaxID=2304196 RepID=UPI0012DA5AEE|nr:hypothetical protein [Scytonema sp. UIC 10036]MUG92288.1 hypothetical protein [Scytonema sp. UIC 10036]